MTQEKRTEHAYEMCLIISTKAPVSVEMLPDVSSVEKLVRCDAQVGFWFLLPHKQTHKLPLLWTLIFGRSLAALFLSLKPAEGFLVLVWDHGPPSFHHRPGRQQQTFIKNVSVHFFRSSFLQSREVCQDRLLKNSPTSWCSHLQTSLLLWCFWGDVRRHFSSKHGVYYYTQRVQFGSRLTRLYSPSIPHSCPHVVQQTLNELRRASSSAVESCVASVHPGFLWNNWTCWFQVFLKLFMRAPVQLVSWLSMLICTSFSSRVKSFFPVSFPITTHHLWT